MSLFIPRIQDYGISAERGFLPIDNPIECLPHRSYLQWETVAKALPYLIRARQIRDVVDQMEIVSTEYLSTLPEIRRAYTILGFILHAYIWGGDEPATVVPQQISIPFSIVCQKLELPPAATYAGLVLWNFKPKVSSSTISIVYSNPSTLTTLTTFTALHDESWFYLISVAIEAHGAPTIPIMLDTIQAAYDQDTLKVITNLRYFAQRLKEIGNLLERMYEHCDPQAFYHRMRPFFAGSQDVQSTGMPDGVVLKDDGTGCPKRVQYKGGSNAQSSLVHFFDIVLGIKHTTDKPESSSLEDKPQSFLDEMRDYMPGPHRRFLEDVAEVANIQDYVLERPHDSTLIAEYNSCISALLNLRNKHIQMVTRYIVIPSRQSQTLQPSRSIVSMIQRKLDYIMGQITEEKERRTVAGGKISSALEENPGKRGTGGTMLIPFLKQTNRETREAAIGEWKR